MSDPAAPCFTARGLAKAHGEGAVHALRGADLDIPVGELVVLPGPSGSGKSINILGMRRRWIDYRAD